MNKYLSRKFLAMLAGVITGIAVIISGNPTQGVSAVIIAIVSYLAAEGYIDAKAVGAFAESAGEIADNVSSGLASESGGENRDQLF